MKKNQIKELVSQMNLEAMLASAASMPLRGIAALFPDVEIEQMEHLLEAINQAVAHS